MKTPRQIDDPILSPEEMCEDANISMSTWRRTYRDRLKIIQISPRRIGARRSNWRQTLEQKTAGGAD